MGREHPRAARPLRRALEGRLIDLTVRKAARDSAWYRERYRDLAPELEGPAPIDRDALAALPTIGREDVDRDRDALRDRWATYLFTSYTSGTTSGRPLMVDRSVQEQEYLARLFGHMRLGAAPVADTDEPIVLNLVSGFHGRQLAIPGRGYSLPVAFDHPSGVAQALALLDRTFPIGGRGRRVTAIAGGLVMLEMLTAELDRRGGPRPPEVRALQTGGDLCGEAARARLAGWWGRPPVDVYSLTEIFLSSTLCPACSRYHFDEFAVAEVVDPWSGAVVGEGRGRLLLTALFPFTQMTPLIRYAPGDLAERTIADCPVDPVGFAFLGRAARAAELEVGGGRELVTHGDAIDALDALPGLRRELHGRLPGPSTGELGAPAVAVRARPGGGVEVVAEARGGGDGEALRRAALARLRAARGSFATAIGHGRLDVRVTAPDGVEPG